MHPALRSALPYALMVIAFIFGWVLAPAARDGERVGASTKGSGSVSASSLTEGSKALGSGEGSMDARKGRVLLGLQDAVRERDEMLRFSRMAIAIQEVGAEEIQAA